MGIDNRRKLQLAFNAAALAIMLIAIIYLSIRFTPVLVNLLEQRDEIKALGISGIAVFILIQVFQVVVAAIPGEVVQIAGGYLYGTFWGTVYLVIGVVIGSVISFFAARLLGFNLVRIMMPAKKLERLYNLLNGPKSELIMFILFLTPGLPKDVLTYIAGLTPVRPLRFIILAVTGRLPALIFSCYIGANFQDQNHTAAIATLAAGVVLFCTGLYFKDSILGRIRRGTNK